MKKKFNLPSDIASEIFRAYDIRGIAHETLHGNDVYAIARAFASELHDSGIRQVAMAYDGRLSSDEFRQALAQGLLDSGMHVLDIGQVPTPVLYYCAYTQAPAGIMLTGSHNPGHYNGLKMVIQRQSPSEDFIKNLQQRILSQQAVSKPGIYESIDISDQYIDDVVQRLPFNRNMKVVVDCGNGVTGAIAPKLIAALGCQVEPLFCDIDGRFPNHHPDPSQAKNLQVLRETVLRTQADLGLAFDGDGDRLGVVTEQGEIIWPDKQLMLYAQAVLRDHPGSTIIYDVKCSRHLGQIVRASGGQPLMWRTGHSLIKRKLVDTGAKLAGEMSGHIFFNDNWYGFDDALYTAARLLALLAQSQQPLSALFASLPDSVNTPELQVTIDEQDKFTFVEQFKTQAEFPQAELIDIDGLRVEFNDAWGLLRASNTGPYLVLRFEADNAEALTRVQAQFKQQIHRVKPELVLPF